MDKMFITPREDMDKMCITPREDMDKLFVTPISVPVDGPQLPILHWLVVKIDLC